MKIFVGTLYTIENEFEECVQAIKQQTYQNFQHFVFRDLPNKEAHDTLYKTFMDSADEFDLMTKVDADMVIEDKYLFSKIVNLFKQYPKLKDLELAVHDYFSNQLIMGMHTYRNNMTWKSNEDNLFVDKIKLYADEVLIIKENYDLIPAALHCKNPSLFQAFHYGVHKALKVIQPDRNKLELVRSKYHWDIISKTYHNFISSPNNLKLAFAVLGCEIGLQGNIDLRHLDYSNPFIMDLFEQYSNYDISDITNIISEIRKQNFSYLPSSLRHEFLSKQIDWIRLFPWLIGKGVQKFGSELQILGNNIANSAKNR